MKHGKAGQTKSSGCYKGTAGGMRGMRIGGGTTHRAGAKGRLMSGGMGMQTGGSFKQSYPKGGGRARHRSMKKGM